MALGNIFHIYGAVVALVLAIIQVKFAAGGSNCQFPAIYNFGDSNSDTGAHSAAFFPIPPPYGETFFKKPNKRLSDGRLIVDIIAEKLGMPYLSAYLDSIGTSFRNGANFATAGSSIQPGPFSPFDLGIQIIQFTEFKSRTSELSNSNVSNGIPLPQDFPKALYILDIGQNDLTAAFQNMTQDQIIATIPGLINKFNQTLQQLYAEGATTFWIHNTGPIGCLPTMALPFKLKGGTLDQNGCVAYQNDVAQEFNRQLKDMVSQLRQQFSQASLTYVDVYSAKYSLISNAKNLGFADPLDFCCGSIVPHYVFCGTSLEVNGTLVNGTACNNPSEHISWDGIHYTDAANQWIASQILNGSMNDPPVPITGACP